MSLSLLWIVDRKVLKLVCATWFLLLSPDRCVILFLRREVVAIVMLSGAPTLRVMFVISLLSVVSPLVLISRLWAVCRLVSDRLVVLCVTLRLTACLQICRLRFLPVRVSLVLVCPKAATLLPALMTCSVWLLGVCVAIWLCVCS